MERELKVGRSMDEEGNMSGSPELQAFSNVGGIANPCPLSQAKAGILRDTRRVLRVYSPINNYKAIKNTTNP